MQPPKPITYTELANNYLKPNGWIVKAPQQQDFFSNHDRIYIEKEGGGDSSFPLQYRSEYKYLQIKHLFDALNIPVPKEINEYYEYVKESERGKLAQRGEAIEDSDSEENKKS